MTNPFWNNIFIDYRVVTPPVDPIVTPVPSNFRGTSANTGALLQWTSLSNTIYEIYRQSGASDVLVTTTTVGISSYNVTGLTNGTAYNFRILANKDGVKSNLSSYISVTPQAPGGNNGGSEEVTPVQGVGSAPDNTSAIVYWSLSGAATGYKVYQKTGTTYTLKATVGASQSSYTVLGLTNGTSYVFAVSAMYGASESAKTDALAVVPTSTGPRGFLKVDPNFTRNSLVDDAAKARYDSWWTYINKQTSLVVYPYSIGKTKRSSVTGALTDTPDGVLDQYQMRFASLAVMNVLLMLDQTGDPACLTWLETYMPKIVTWTKKTSQLTASKYKDWGTFSGGGVRQYLNHADGGLERQLEQDLIIGWHVEVLYAFKQNASRVNAAALTDYEDFILNHLVKGKFYRALRRKGTTADKSWWAQTNDPKDDMTCRQVFDAYAASNHSKKPITLERWGQYFWHPSISMYAASWFLYKMYGWAEFKDSHEQQGAWLQEIYNNTWATSTKGELASVSHEVYARKKYIEGSPNYVVGSAFNAQDSTYPREGAVHMELVERSGSPYITDRFLKGYSRTLLYCTLQWGPTGKDVNGGRPKLPQYELVNGKRVVKRDTNGNIVWSSTDDDSSTVAGAINGTPKWTSANVSNGDKVYIVRGTEIVSNPRAKVGGGDAFHNALFSVSGGPTFCSIYRTGSNSIYNELLSIESTEKKGDTHLALFMFEQSRR